MPGHFSTYQGSIRGKLLCALGVGVSLIIPLGFYLNYQAGRWAGARLSDLLSRISPLVQDGRYTEAEELIRSAETGSWARKLPFGQWDINYVTLQELTDSIQALQRGDFVSPRQFHADSFFASVWKKVPHNTKTFFAESIKSKAETMRQEVETAYKGIAEKTRPIVERATKVTSRPTVKGTILVWDYEKGTISDHYCALPQRFKGTPRDPAITIFGIRKSKAVFEGAYQTITGKGVYSSGPITHGLVELVVVYYPSMQEVGVVVLELPRRFHGNLSAPLYRPQGALTVYDLPKAGSGPEDIDVAGFIQGLSVEGH